VIGGDGAVFVCGLQLVRVADAAGVDVGANRVLAGVRLPSEQQHSLGVKCPPLLAGKPQLSN